MVSLIVLVIGLVVFSGLGFAGVSGLDDWQTVVRVALALMFVFTGLSHFGKTKYDMVKMMPPVFPNPLQLVYLTGAFEILGGVGLVFLPDLRGLVALSLILLLLAIFPANIYAALHRVIFRGKPATNLWLRTPMQVLYIILLVLVIV